MISRNENKLRTVNLERDPVEVGLYWHNEGRDVALATVIATWGSSPLPVGSQLVVDSNGAFEGSISGGCIEGAVITEAMDVIKNGRGKRLSFGVSNDQAWEVGLACGGEIEVYVEKFSPNTVFYENLTALKKQEKSVCTITDLISGHKDLLQEEDSESIERLPPELKHAVSDSFLMEKNILIETDNEACFIHAFKPYPRLIIIGAVHIAMPLAHMASLTGYRVLVIDPRSAFANAERFPDVKIMVEWPDEALKKITMHSRTAFVVLTHDPKIDDPALIAALNSEAFYIGALGSRATHKSRLERLGKEGVDDDSLKRIHGPVGLDIKAITPSEIAVSILGEIISKRRKADLKK